MAKIQKRGNLPDHVVSVPFKNGKLMNLVRVPTNAADTSEESFNKSASKWAQSSLEMNAGGKAKTTLSAKRMSKYLMRKHPAAVDEAMREEKIGVPERMSAAKMAAMYKLGGVSSRKRRRAMNKVL